MIEPFQDEILRKTYILIGSVYRDNLFESFIRRLTMYISMDCQSRFLKQLIENQSYVSIYLKNGVRLTGKIIGLTDDIVFLNTPVPQLVYKKQINTILPSDLIKT